MNAVHDQETGDEHIYCFDGYGGPKLTLHRYTAKRHRFAGLSARKTSGWFSSKVMEAGRADSLYLNYRTTDEKNSEISVELQSIETNEAIRHFTHDDFKKLKDPLNELRHKLVWRSTSVLPARRFRVHVRLRNSIVFEVTVAPAAEVTK